MSTISAPKKRDENGLTTSERVTVAEAQAAKYKLLLVASVIANVALLLFAAFK
jgi:hypothetical protein